MKTAYVILSLALATSAMAQSTTYRDSMGRQTGSATTHGNNTTYRDSMGRETGTATTRGNTTNYYDSKGRSTGTATGAPGWQLKR